MTEIDKNHEFKQSEKSSLYYEEFPGSGVSESRKNDQEIIDMIGSFMKDEAFSLENESSFTINKILSFLDREIDENQNFTEALLIKGTLLYKTGKCNIAIETFDRALETIPKEIPGENLSLWTESDNINYKYALKLKAFALFRLGKYKEGLDVLNEILAVYPDDMEIQEYKTVISTLENESLIKELNNLPYLYPEKSGTWERGDQQAYEPDKYARALEKLDKSLEINPQDADIWWYRGSALYMLGRYAEALEAFDKSLEINPKNEDVWSFKGSTLYMLGMPEKALKALDKALRKNPNKLETWFNKASIFFELGRYQQALSAVDNALRINANDKSALNLKNSILRKLGKESII